LSFVIDAKFLIKNDNIYIRDITVLGNFRLSSSWSVYSSIHINLLKFFGMHIQNTHMHVYTYIIFPS